MEMSTFGSVGKAVVEYTGSHIVALEGVPDPQVPGCFAFRALVKPQRGNAHYAEFLVRGVALKSVTAADLEEVVFTSWPPVAR